MGEHTCKCLGIVDEIELNCTETCYKSGRSLLFSRTMFRRRFSGQVCLWTKSHNFPSPALPSSAFLHLCSSKETENCLCLLNGLWPCSTTMLPYLMTVKKAESHIWSMAYEEPWTCSSSCCTRRRLGQHNSS